MATNTKICPIIYAGALGTRIEASRDYTLGEVGQCHGSSCAWWTDGACGIVANRIVNVVNSHREGKPNADD